jgi:hypothetical protein
MFVPGSSGFSRLARLPGTTPGWLALLALGALSARPGTALAQEDRCRDPISTARAPVEVTPAAGAGGVTLDAPVVVRYSRGYFEPGGPGDDPATLFRLARCPAGTLCGVGCRPGEGTDVPGTVQVISDRLVFLPAAGLEPAASYVGRATGVDGFLDFQFCTGSLVDSGPPELGAFVGAEPSGPSAGCVLPEGGRRVALRWEPARDDGSPGSIEYLLYLTRAAGVDAPELRDRIRNYTSREITLSMILDREESAEPVCVRLLALDGVGNVSEPSEEQCFDPQTAAAFQPLCAVSAPGAQRAVLLARRRSSRRAPGPRGRASRDASS